MQFLVAAFPLLAETDVDIIQSYRQLYDPLHSMIDPHFTFVFPVASVDAATFVHEVYFRAEWFKQFSFVLRCATVSKDSFSDDYHIFLVPDEGYSHAVKLHDRLYDGLLLPHRRFDIDYIPHISIARSGDKMKMKDLADEWNVREIAIPGKIAALEILSYDAGVVKPVDKIELR